MVKIAADVYFDGVSAMALHVTQELCGEWPRGPASNINFTEVKHGCVRSKNWMGDLPDERPKQLTPPSFGRDVKLGVPCLDAACIVGLN